MVEKPDSVSTYRETCGWACGILDSLLKIWVGDERDRATVKAVRYALDEENNPRLRPDEKPVLEHADRELLKRLVSAGVDRALSEFENHLTELVVDEVPGPFLEERRAEDDILMGAEVDAGGRCIVLRYEEFPSVQLPLDCVKKFREWLYKVRRQPEIGAFEVGALEVRMKDRQAGQVYSLDCNGVPISMYYSTPAKLQEWLDKVWAWWVKAR